ncbi:Protein CHROMATIN REMODELING 4 [Linum perenne]
MKYRNLPNFLDKSLNTLRDIPMFPGSNIHRHSKGKEVIGSSSSENKLPHWLREAVSAPARSLEPDIPPTVSAIAQSVRMLYGEDKSTIPPFVIPGPPPSQPKDPRRALRRKKKKRPHMYTESPLDIAGSSNASKTNIDDTIGVPSSDSLAPHHVRLPPLVPETSGLPSNGCEVNSQHPGFNTESSLTPPQHEVPQLVASCTATLVAGSSIASSSLPEGTTPLPKSADLVECIDTQSLPSSGRDGDVPSLPSSPVQGAGLEERKDEDEGDGGGECSKTPPVEEVVSSEGTVSDGGNASDDDDVPQL